VIDSSQGELGPIFLDHARTLGAAGATNANLLGQRAAFSELDGADLGMLSGPGDIVLQPADGPAIAAELVYDVDVRVAAIAPSLTYGVTDSFDLSLLLPVVHLEADVGATNRPVFALNSSGAFQRIPRAEQRTIASRQVVRVTGVSDLTLRGKQQLGWRAGALWAATLAVQFPTGNPDNGLGTGDYWLSPSLVAVWPFLGGTAELNVNAGLNLDLNTIKASEASYGVGLSGRLWPGVASGVVEVLGRSQLAEGAFALDTGVLYLLPSGTLDQRSFLGTDFGRRDFFTLVFGLRMLLPLGVVAFVAGTVALNDDGMQARPVTPVAGLGLTF
jgi:hypothetical protein